MPPSHKQQAEESEEAIDNKNFETELVAKEKLGGKSTEDKGNDW